MFTPLLATKLYLPSPRPLAVARPRLLARLDEGLHGRLTLISAPAGFGKSTLASAWAAGCGRPVAWLALDAGDNDPVRFLAYLTTAVQTVASTIGEGVLAVLRSPQPPPAEAILTTLLNEIAALSDKFVLVLDDYHVVEAAPVDHALAFLLDHLPAQMHLVIATREDPPLPLARLRARGQLTELRAADLRFTLDESAAFLNQAMGLRVAAADIAALETRTEGWIAGLQLAAISMQGHPADSAAFIDSFTGSNRFVMDFLVEEVLHQQPASVQTFLLCTAILDRLCGPLCDAVVADPAATGEATLNYLERANLFLIPLDNERRWYRYHHLFGDLLRQRLQHEAATAHGAGVVDTAALHIRASLWFEENGLELDAFHHAVAANDVARATRLAEGQGMPLLFRGAVAPVLNWLASLPATDLDARPGLWVMYASALLFVNQVTGIEEKLHAAEAALQGVEPDDQTRDLIGHIASIRATVALTQHQADTIMAQSNRALTYLHPANLPVRAAATWTLGYAYQLQGQRTAAGQAYTAALATSQAIGHTIVTLMASLGLGHVQEADNQLAAAANTYRRVIELAGDPPLPTACGAHLGLARIHYEWNDLAAADRHAQQSLHLARQIEFTDRFIASEVFCARLCLARGDAAGAAALLAGAEQAVHQHSFVLRLPEIAAAQVLVFLHQGNLAAAAQLAQMHALPVSQARVHLAQGDAAAALALLAPLGAEADAQGWLDERLKLSVLQALAHQAYGDADAALRRLSDALALAASGGFIRLFVDEGAPMAQLLAVMAARGVMPEYVNRLLAAFPMSALPFPDGRASDVAPRPSPLVEPLSPRELEILQLIADGLSNQEIGAKLYLALDTVKGHNRRIFEKLQVQRRTEAVARGRALGLLPQQ